MKDASPAAQTRFQTIPAVILAELDLCDAANNYAAERSRGNRETLMKAAIAFGKCSDSLVRRTP